MNSTPLRLLRPALLALFTANVLLACSAPSTLSAADGQGATLVLSAQSMYASLSSLPETGPGSLAATYDNFGRMSVMEYFHDQLNAAPNSHVTIDGMDLGNPHETMAAKESLFERGAKLYASVAAFWAATDSAPNLFSSESEYAADLKASVGATESGLQLVDNNAQGCARSATATLLLAAMQRSWMGASELESSTDSTSSTAAGRPTATARASSSQTSTAGSTTASASASGGDTASSSRQPTQPVAIPTSRRFGTINHAQFQQQMQRQARPGSFVATTQSALDGQILSDQEAQPETCPNPNQAHDPNEL